MRGDTGRANMKRSGSRPASWRDAAANHYVYFHRQRSVDDMKTGRKKMNAVEEIFASAIRRGLGNKPAICFRDQEISYAVLLERINRVGNGLKAAGVGRENRVLFMMNDTPEL